MLRLPAHLACLYARSLTTSRFPPTPSSMSTSSTQVAEPRSHARIATDAPQADAARPRGVGRLLGHVVKRPEARLLEADERGTFQERASLDGDLEDILGDKLALFVGKLLKKVRVLDALGQLAGQDHLLSRVDVDAVVVQAGPVDERFEVIPIAEAAFVSRVVVDLHGGSLVLLVARLRLDGRLRGWRAIVDFGGGSVDRLARLELG